MNNRWLLCSRHQAHSLTADGNETNLHALDLRDDGDAANAKLQIAHADVIRVSRLKELIDLLE